jgi:hypothetical protein
MTTRLLTKGFLTGLAILLGTTMGAPSARAEEQQVGVARISLIHGDVSTQRGDSGDWGAATVNTPVVAGDHISTGTRSRAEVQLDYANILRMDERANVKIAELSRTRAQIQVVEGLVNYTVLKGSEADVEIDTPNVAIRPGAGEGSYRILVIDDQTHVIVRKGEVEVTTPQGSTRVKQDQQIDVRGRDNPEFQIVDAPGRDDWDKWNKDRDQQIRDAESWHHTNPYYAGTEDLDHHGRWAYVPGYGDVWQPYVSPDWAPYRDGRWVWEPYYGWTWVSYEPWGWAPYHYGRWFYYGGAWDWWPGPIYPAYYPVWAPAYVSFFGFGIGHHWGFGFGFGSVGWLPIGPSDCFFPWWGGNRRNIDIINVTNITNITNITNVHNGVGPVAPLATGRPVISNLTGILTNNHLQHGITAMPTEKFGHFAVSHNTVPVSAKGIREGGMVAGNLPVVPTKESLRAVDRPVNPSTVRQRTGQPEHFFTKTQPTYTLQPFHQQAAQVEQAIQQHQAATQPARAGVPAATAPTRTEHAAISSNPAATPRAATQTPTPGSAADRQTWDRFGPATTTPTDHAVPQRQAETRRQAPVQPAPQSPAASRPSSQPTSNATGGSSGGSSSWQKFSGPSRPPVPESRVPQQPRETNRPTVSAPTPAPAPRPATPPQSSAWQHFTPQPTARQETRFGSVADRSSSVGRPPIMERGQSRNWQSSGYSGTSTYRDSPRTDYRPEPRTDYRPAPRTEYRPPLDLHRSIVTPRSSGSYDGGSSRGGGGSYGGGRSSAPSGGSRGGSGGGSSSHPQHGSGSHGHG